MTGNEIAEINEIRQVLDDALVRIDRAYRTFNSQDKDEGFNDLAQSVKALLNIKERLERLPTCNRNPHASDSGAYM